MLLQGCFVIQALEEKCINGIKYIKAVWLALVNYYLTRRSFFRLRLYDSNVNALIAL